MESLPYADIIILALIAGFILLRLRNVLGQKTGDEQPPMFKRGDKDVLGQPVVVQLADKLNKIKPKEDSDSYLTGLQNGPIADTLGQIKLKDPFFNATVFLNGAKMAYEMVFDAFSKGDKKTLEMLLDAPLYQAFAAQIDANAQDAHKTELTLVSVKAKGIIDASLIGNMARLSVRFDSEQVNVVKDAEGNVIQGNTSDVDLMDDEWLFERDVTSKNPNWKIIET